jgi:hypothetical protein
MLSHADDAGHFILFWKGEGELASFAKNGVGMYRDMKGLCRFSRQIETHSGRRLIPVIGGRRKSFVKNAVQVL